MNTITKGLLASLVAYSSHFGITKLYNIVCIPDGFYGYLEGLFTTGSPLCSTLLTAMTYTQVTYNTLVVTGLARCMIDMVDTLKFEKKD